ncbi:hypothetical protein E1292_15005 [Nonomuraea deserti]|uniref:Uncharacterized protein n=1 Tax=Nonomuraea deserti TaxID=1848322 RepID=A0A4R4VLF9_9ACTN|nr:hypothetical protein E1292_15005 [Nonomuraea deserti]
MVLGLGGGWLLWQSSGDGEGEGGDAAAAGDPATLNVLKKGRLTAEDVGTVDPTALFYAGFRKMATQPILHLTQESYTEESEYRQGEPGYVWESGFDYRTKEFRMVWGSADPEDPITVCRDGASYDYSYRLRRWDGPDTGDYLCRLKSAYRYISDGISTGGMTEAQADRWIKALQTEYNGFVNPRELRLTEVKGKQYLRLVVDYTPVKRADDLYYGGQSLMWSFKKSGLDPQSHPYSYTGGMGTGFHAVYHLDPGSLLTAYSEVEVTPAVGKDGRPREDGDFYKVRVEYHHPGRLPAMKPEGSPARPELTWPRDKA